MVSEPKPRCTLWYFIRSDLNGWDAPGHTHRALTAHFRLATDLPLAILERGRSNAHQEESNA